MSEASNSSLPEEINLKLFTTQRKNKTKNEVKMNGKQIPKLMPCLDCGKEISTSAVTCPNCGKPYHTDNRKSRPFFIFLAIVYGSIGLHNFYAQNFKPGFIKFAAMTIAMAILLGGGGQDSRIFFLFVFSFCQLFALFEAFTCKVDANCIPFKE